MSKKLILLAGPTASGKSNLAIKLAKKAQLKGLVIESHNVIVENKDLFIDMVESNNMFLISTNFLKKEF